MIVQYLRMVNPASRRQRESLLSAFVKPLGEGTVLGDLTYGDVQYLRDHMAERFRPVSVNNALSAFRRLVRVAAEAGEVPMEKYFELTSVEGLPLPSARPDLPKSHPDVRSIVEACWNLGTAMGQRDAFVCAAFLADGLSAAEVLRLQPDHIELPSGKLLTARHDRYLTEITLDALRLWLQARGGHAGFIVEPLRERQSAKSASGQLVYDIVKRGAALAGIHEFKTRGKALGSGLPDKTEDHEQGRN